MNEVLNAAAAVASFVGWQGVLGAVLGAWVGDWMGRKHPDAWGWMRAGVKKAGDALKD